MNTNEKVQEQEKVTRKKTVTSKTLKAWLAHGELIANDKELCDTNGCKKLLEIMQLIKERWIYINF